MGKTKRILSFLIAVIMVLALVPFNAIIYAVDVQSGDEAQTETQAPEKDKDLPSATVSKLDSQTISQYKIFDLVDEEYKGEGTDPLNPQVLMQFLAKDTAEEAANNKYAEYITDFYITVDGLENATKGTGCYLIGYYEPFKWVVVPLDEVEIENTTYPVITRVGHEFTYADICTSVKDFRCGIYFTPEFLAANPGMSVSLELGLSASVEDAQAAKYTKVGETYTYKATDLGLPGVTVNKLPATEITEFRFYDYFGGASGFTDGEGTVKPQVLMQFLAQETLEEANAGGFADFVVDFFVKIEGLAQNEIVGEDCYLIGNYGEFGWVVIPLDQATFENGVTYPVVSVYDRITYRQVCESVKDFTCGIYFEPEFLAANPNFKITVELGISKTYDDAKDGIYYNLGETYTYTARDLAGNPSVVIPDSMTGDVVDEIKNNTALDGYTPENLPENAELVIELVSVGETIVYDVTPMLNGAEIKDLAEAIKFRLPVPASVNAPQVKVYHDGALMGAYDIKGTGNARYVEISSADFSEFAIEPYAVLPSATVTPIINPDLSFGLKFEINEITEAQLNYYGDWYADFTIVFNVANSDLTEIVLGTGEGADGWLSGNYGEYGWINVPYNGNVTIELGKPIKVMDFAAKLMGKDGLKITYREVYELVKEFNCGVYLTPEFIEANGEFTVSVDLAMFEEVVDENGNVTEVEHTVVYTDKAGNVIDKADVTVFDKEDVYVAYVAEVGEQKFESVIGAINYAVANGITEVKLLKSVRELMPTDVEIVIKNNLTITADTPVEVKFYNNGTNYDFIIDCEGYGDYDFTIGENVTFVLEDRVIWVGYYGSNIDVVVNGTLSGGQIWLGGDIYVNETGTIKSTNEAFVIRRGKTLFVDGGKVEANYFTILAGNIFAENGSEIASGALWIGNTGSYANEGAVSITLWDSTLTVKGNLKSASDKFVNIDVYNSTVEITDVHGYGASVLDANTTLYVDGESGKLTIYKGLNNNGVVDVYDGGELIIANNATVTNNGSIYIDSISTISGPANMGVETEVANMEVEYVDGKYILVEKISYVASVNGVGYATLLEALAAAKAGDTVKLLGDLTLAPSDVDYYTNIKIPAGVTLDGENYTLVVEQTQDSDYATIWSDGAYTVQNITIKVMGRREATRSIINFSKGGALINATLWSSVQDIGVNYDKPVNGMTLLVEGCTIQTGAYAFYCDPNSSVIDVTIKNNTITANRFGSMQHSEKILNNTLTATCTKGLSLGESFTGVVSGNVFNGARALSVYGTQTISGNVFNNGSCVELNNGAVADLSANYWGGEAPAEGRIVADKATSVVVYTLDSYYADAELTELITIAKPVASINGVGYASLEEAIAAAQNGDVVTLFADVTTATTIVINKAITLDGNGHKLTSTAARAINVSGADGVTIKNLTIDCTGERAINIIQKATNVTIDNVTATAANYTVNVAASAPSAVVAIKNSTLNGLCTVNVAGAGAYVTVDNSTINCNDNNTTAGESYAALGLIKEAVGGSIIATNTTVNVAEGSDSVKGKNGAENGTVTINGSTDGVVVIVAAITYPDSNYYYAFATLAEAIEFAKAGDTITLIRNVTLSETIAVDKSVTIDLNGKKVTSTAQKAFEIYADATITNGTIEAAQRCVDTRKAVKLTLTDVNLVADNYYSKYGNPQPLTIGGSENGTVVTLTNVNISSAAGYGIITFVKTDLTATNCTIGGYNALYVKPGSEGSVFNFANCDLTGSTVGNDVKGNSFSTIAVRADDVSLYVDADSTITASGNYCWAISMDSTFTGETGSTGATIVIAGTINGQVVTSIDASKNTVTLKADYADEVTAGGYAYITNNNGTITLAKAVATANGVGYATLQDAIKAGGEVVLLTDIELDAPITVIGTVVLDLNGKTISYTSTTQNEAMITNKGNLTINDSVGEGVINYNYVGAADNSYGKGNYTISNAGTLTVNGGKITIAKLSGHAKYPIDNNSTTGDATLVINGGHLYNYNTSAIRMFCNSTTYKNSVTINGGKIEGYCAIWVQNPGSKTVNANLTIAGGEIKTTAKAYVNGTAALKDVSSSIYFTISGNGGAWSADSSVAITGGTINENVNLKDEAPEAYNVEGNATFNGRLELPMVPVATVNGVEYGSLQEAINAAKDGDTVVLVADIADSATIKIVGKAITLDLNGKAIYGQCNASQSTLVYIENGAKLTVKDEVGTGKISFAQGTSNVGWTIDVKGEFVLESGTIELTGSWSIGYAVDVRPNSWGTEYKTGSKFTMNGGTILSSDGGVRVASSSVATHTSVSASFVMNGGAISAAWDGVFVQQSDAAYDVLSFTMNGGTIESALNPVRVYGPVPTGYVNGQNCMNITLAGGTMTYTGTAAYEWVIDGILRVGGGASVETIVENGTLAVSAEIAESATAPEGYAWSNNGNGTYTLAKKVLEQYLSGSTVVLNESFTIRFYISASKIAADKDYYAVITVDGVETIVAAKADWVKFSSAYYYVDVKLTTKQMTDAVEVAIYEGADTTARNTQVSLAYSTSIKQYALNQLVKTSSTAALKRVLVDMLNLGAKAQLQFNYKTDNLANAGLTAEQLAFGTAEEVEATKDNYVNNASGIFYGTTASLVEKIELNLYFVKAYAKSNVKFVVSYTDYHGDAKSFEFIGSEIADSSGYAVVKVPMVASDIRTVVTCEVYVDNVSVGTVTHSIEAYCAGKTGIFQDIMKFGTSANAYFNN